MIVGQGMYRDCMVEWCRIRYGCYQPDGRELKCDNCTEVCPDTHEASHGICDACFPVLMSRAKKK